MNGIKEKMRSPGGASITFALLLFLVVAVLCAVINAAATSTAGRMSGIAEMDERYYSVTSASELMKKLLDGKTVTVVKKTTEADVTQHTVTNYDGNTVTEKGEPSQDGDPVEELYLVNDVDAADIDMERDLTSLTKVEGNATATGSLQMDSIQNEAAFRYAVGSGGGVVAPTILGRELLLTSTVKATATDLDPLAVTIVEDLDVKGNITLTITSTNGKEAAPGEKLDKFTQQLLFGADVKRSESTSQEDGVPQGYSQTKTTENGKEKTVIRYKVRTETSELKMVSLTWKLLSTKILTG